MKNKLKKDCQVLDLNKSALYIVPDTNTYNISFGDSINMIDDYSDGILKDLINENINAWKELSRL